MARRKRKSEERRGREKSNGYSLSFYNSYFVGRNNFFRSKTISKVAIIKTKNVTIAFLAFSKIRLGLDTGFSLTVKGCHVIV